jgi:fumarylpyruvate hydrolase
MDWVFPPAAVPALGIVGRRERFPVHRIYCIGRNYADHAKEMGATVDRAQPVFFCKPADAIIGGDGGEVAVPYPPATAELHHEVEMVVALGAGGRGLDAAAALDCVFGYGVGLDLTRRDLQTAAKAAGLPWDAAKAFDHSAPVSRLRAAADIGHPRRGTLSLAVNGTMRQSADIGTMILPVPAILAALSGLFELKPGDLVFTGTPAGVAVLERGDGFHAGLEGIATLEGRLV